MTLHEGWHKAHPNYPCEYDTCPRGQVLDLEHATYTAAEVKVLTEDACKVAAEAGRRIGRAEAGMEIRLQIAALPTHDENDEPILARDMRHAASMIARAFAYPGRQEASEPRTDPSMGMDLPPEPQAVRELQGDA